MINRKNYKSLSLIATLLGFLAALPAQAQLMIYPMKGQSNEQLSKDRYECHMWAVQQSGFDPTNTQVTQQAPQNHQSGQVYSLSARVGRQLEVLRVMPVKVPLLVLQRAASAVALKSWIKTTRQAKPIRLHQDRMPMITPSRLA